LALLGYDYWKTRFAQDRAVVGKSIRVGNALFTVAGVMPPGFRGLLVGFPPDVLMPLDMYPRVENGADGAQTIPVNMMGRIGPSVSMQQAQAALASRWPQAIADSAPPGVPRQSWMDALGPRVEVTSGNRGYSRIRRDYSQPLLVLLAMAALVLLGACANLGSLLLARGVRRQREFGIRASLGASPGRLARQLFTENLLLAAVGGLASVPLARWEGVAALRFFPPGNLPMSLDLRIDGRVLTFTLAASLLTVVVCGFAPAWQAVRVSAWELTKAGAAQSSAGFGLRKALVTFQIAVSVLLLIGAGLFVSTLRALVATETGLGHGTVLLAPLIARTGTQRSEAGPYFDELLQRVGAIPGVRSAGLTDREPLQPTSGGEDVGEATDEAAAAPVAGAQVQCASSGFFQALGIGIAEGRDFSPSERSVTSPVILNQELARRLFPGREAVGRFVRVGRRQRMRRMQVIGVVKDVRYGALRQPVMPYVYVPCGQKWSPAALLNVLTLVVCTDRGASPELAAAVRRDVDALGVQVVFKVSGLAERIEEAMLRERMLATIMTAFGVLALAVVCTGLYGLIAFLVNTRTREIGVYIALGARPSTVLWIVGREMFWLVLAGEIVGLLTALWVTRFAAAWLYQVSPTQPSVLGSAVLLVATVACVAALPPLRRAWRMDPTVALRYE
jgi:predicted permease